MDEELRQIAKETNDSTDNNININDIVLNDTLRNQIMNNAKNNDINLSKSNRGKIPGKIFSVNKN